MYSTTQVTVITSDYKINSSVLLVSQSVHACIQFIIVLVLCILFTDNNSD